jgi:hypothetical protein
MNQDFILGRLSEIMGWDTDQARQEFAWLRLISQMKYDGYQDFLAGMRFIESLADWLQQFEQHERAAAYNLIRRSLIYISTAEMNHLVELFYPETVQWRLQNAAAGRLGIPPYRVWAAADSAKLYRRLLRQTLFVELSDGARIDVFRRTNAGTISNEQVINAPRINQEKWDDLLGDLRRDLDDDTAMFTSVFLIDDFIASGTTLLRKEGGNWKGKLARFWHEVQGMLLSHFESGWTLNVHHYIGTRRAERVVHERQKAALAEYGDGNWFGAVQFSFGIVLPEGTPIDATTHPEFVELAQRYYDDSIETKHMKLGGHDARLGFGSCALPLILEHNTPNNSVALLWAETRGGNGKHAMCPLFRRRQRHV